jgi:hypothetical protein
MLPNVQNLIGTDAVSSLWAYLDPGTGSMLFQVLIAGLLSSLFFVKSTYLQLREVVLGRRDGA